MRQWKSILNSLHILRQLGRLGFQHLLFGILLTERHTFFHRVFLRLANEIVGLSLAQLKVVTVEEELTLVLAILLDGTDFRVLYRRRFYLLRNILSNDLQSN